MSRPPNQYNEAPGHVGNRFYSDQQTIDFKVGNPYGCDPSEYPPAAIYAQAGFPGYTQQAAGYGMQGYNQISSQTTFPQNQVTTLNSVSAQGVMPQYHTQVISAPACMPMYSQQGHIPQSVASPAYQPMYAPQSIAAAAALSPVSYSHASLESEAVVQDRIKANIDAIMESQKTAMLNSKLETLTDKVQSLTQSIENSETSHVKSLSDRVERLSRNIAESGDGIHHIKSLSTRVENLSRNLSDNEESSCHLKSLSEKVDRLSRSIELSQKHPASGPVESLSSTIPVSTSASDSDISRRLRRLAAESSVRQTRSGDLIPDW